jgi:hypothetical protein
VADENLFWILDILSCFSLLSRLADARWQHFKDFPIIAKKTKGCQIFRSYNTPKREKCTKWPQILSNGHKMYQMAVLLQTVIKYIVIFDYKSLRKHPKLGFLVRKYSIWQPREKDADRKRSLPEFSAGCWDYLCLSINRLKWMEGAYNESPVRNYGISWSRSIIICVRFH